MAPGYSTHLARGMGLAPQTALGGQAPNQHPLRDKPPALSPLSDLPDTDSARRIGIQDAASRSQISRISGIDL